MLFLLLLLLLLPVAVAFVFVLSGENNLDKSEIWAVEGGGMCIIVDGWMDGWLDVLWLCVFCILYSVWIIWMLVIVVYLGLALDSKRIELN